MPLWSPPRLTQCHLLPPFCPALSSSSLCLESFPLLLLVMTPTHPAHLRTSVASSWLGPGLLLWASSARVSP